MVNSLKQRVFTISLIFIVSAYALACASARVINQTDSTAVIQGVGPTEFEAKSNATDKAKEILGETITESQAAECNQEYKSRGRTSGTGNNKQYKQSGKTYYSCVLYFQKK